MESAGYLVTILVKYKSRLLITYLLFAVEMSADLFKPLFIGKAVNGLLSGSFHALFIFLLLHIGWAVAGMIRIRYDTRTYSGIYNDIILQFLSEKSAKEVSRLSAHSTLTRELTDFLEFDLVYVLEAAFNIFGSLVLLLFYDIKVVAICFLLLFPIALISKRYGKKMQLLTHHKNNEIEKQVDAISSFNKEVVQQHYRALQKWQIKIADQQATNFGVMELLVVVLLGFSFLLATQHHRQVLNEGELIGIYFYILKFSKGLETIPYTLEKYASLKDILERIRHI